MVDEVVNVGWFTRLKNAVIGVVMGLVLTCVSVPLLFWNEGRTVKTEQALVEGERAVVPIAPQPVDPSRENQLVYLQAAAVTDGALHDADFGVTVPALKLKRDAEIFQWKEDEKTESKKKIGGGQSQQKTYSYDKVWSKEPIDSSKFKKASGHENHGTLPFSSHVFTAEKITVGAYRLSDGLTRQLSGYAQIALPPEQREKASEAVRSWKVTGDHFYRGEDPGAPKIGDIRVRFSQIVPGDVSLLAQQSGDTFRPYMTKVGRAIERLEMGNQSAEAMFAHARAENNLLKWLLRGGGFVLMAVGIGLVFRPLVVVADVLPLMGDLLGMGVFAFAVGAAAFGSLLTIAAGWIFFRPVLGVSLAAAAVAVLGLLMYLGHQARARRIA